MLGCLICFASISYLILEPSEFYTSYLKALISLDNFTMFVVVCLLLMFLFYLKHLCCLTYDKYLVLSFSRHCGKDGS